MLWTIIISLQLVSFQTVPEISLNRDTLSREINPQKAVYSESCPEIAHNELSSASWQQEPELLRSKIEIKECSDIRITFKFIEKVLDNNALDHLDYAEQLFNKTLSTPIDQTAVEMIKDEARKLFPLLSDGEKEAWKQKIEKDDPSLANDIKKFWKLRDPVLSTPVNERLREHWERIAYARKEFTRNNDGIYGSDDRGTIFVKLGPPTFKRSGMLSLETTEIRSKLYDLSYFKGGISPREMFNLNMSIKQQYMPKYYEVWVYRNLESRRPVLFIFGESPNRGSFGLRKSVEEFISSGSYNMGITSSYRYGSGPRGLSAGPFLQMSLYNELSTIDIYFGNQLTKYDQNWLRYLKGDMNFSSLKMLNNSNRAEWELRKIQEQAPDAQSTLTDNLDLVDQNYKVYRFLDEHNEPVNKMIVFSTPHEELTSKDALIFQHQYPIYELDLAARIIDQNGQQTYADKNKLPLENKKHNTEGVMLEVPASENIQKPDSPTLVLSSEISRIPTVTNNQNVTERVIIASTVNKISEITSLASETKTLEVSDLIWGYRADQKNHLIDELPFAIPADSKVPKGKNLMIYFETYHLESRSDSLFHYQMDYSIHRKKRRKIVDTGIQLTVNFSSQNSTSKELLEIKTSELEPGSYLISCRFKSDDAAESVVRTIDFEVYD